MSVDEEFVALRLASAQRMIFEHQARLPSRDFRNSRAAPVPAKPPPPMTTSYDSPVSIAPESIAPILLSRIRWAASRVSYVLPLERA